MIGPLQSAPEYEVPGVTPAERVLAFGVLFLLAAALALLLWRSKYRGLPDRLARQKAELQGAVADADLHRARFTSGDALATGEPRLRALLRGEAETPPRTTDAARDVGEAILSRALPYWRRAPPLVRRLGALAVGTAVFGALAVSTATIVRALRADGGEAAPPELVDLAASETAAFVAAVHAAVAGLPGVGALWEILTAIALIGGEWLYQHWYVSAVLLAVGAVLIHALHRRVGEPDTGLVRSRPWAAVEATGVVVAAWILGVGLWRVGTQVGSPRVGGTRLPIEPAMTISAGLAALFVIALGITAGLRRLHSGLQRSARAAEGPSVAVALYLLARPLWSGLAAVLLPFVAVYVAVGLTRTPRVLVALLAASWYVQTAAVALAVGLAAVFALATREAWATVRKAASDVAARTGLRTKVVLWGAPATATVLATLLLYGLTRSWPAAIAVAGLLGAVIGLVATWARRLWYRADFGTPERSKNAVVVEAGTLEVAEATHYYARLNGTHHLLAPDADRLLADIQAAGGGLFEGGSPEPTIAAAYYDTADRVGILDYEDATTKLFEQVRKAIYDQGYRHGRIEKEVLADRLNRKYPESIWQLRLGLAKDRWNVVERRRDGEQIVEFRNFPNRGTT